MSWKLKVVIFATYNLQRTTQNKTTEHKDIPYRAKAVEVEESKEGYTGDALALRGDEGRDKLR